MKTAETLTPWDLISEITRELTPNDYLADCGMAAGRDWLIRGDDSEFWLEGPSGRTKRVVRVDGPRLEGDSAEDLRIVDADVTIPSIAFDLGVDEARAFSKMLNVAAGYAEELNRAAEKMLPEIREAFKAQKERIAAENAETERVRKERAGLVRPYEGDRCRITLGSPWRGEQFAGELVWDEKYECHVLDDGKHLTAAGKLRTNWQRQKGARLDHATRFEVMGENGRFQTVIEWDER